MHAFLNYDSSSSNLIMTDARTVFKEVHLHMLLINQYKIKNLLGHYILNYRFIYAYEITYYRAGVAETRD